MSEAANSPSLSVLLVEDSTSNAAMIRRHLDATTGGNGVADRYIVDTVPSLDEAVARMTSNKYDILILDISLPGVKGNDDIMSQLSEFSKALPVVVLVGNKDDHKQALNALRSGAQDFIAKDQLSGEFLRLSIRNSLERMRVLTEMKKMNQRLSILSVMDSMTETRNKLGLQLALKAEHARSLRQGTSLSAIIVDIGNLQEINSQHGYAAGDNTLIEIAKRLKSIVRASDILGRPRGRQFLAILPDTKLSEAMVVAGKLRQAASYPPITLHGGRIVHPHVTVASCVVEDGNSDLDDLIARLDNMLVKSSLSSGSIATAPGGDKPNLINTSLLKSLSRPENFYSMIQPIFRLKDNEIAGYEILSRSQIKGFETPRDFFMASMNLRLLAAVDLNCLEMALATAAKLQLQKRAHVNLYPSTLAEHGADKILKIMDKHKIRNICLEFSEHHIAGNYDKLIEHTKKLRSAGVVIALDDVGFGRSSIESLILLEPQVVKIDRERIHGIATSIPLLNSFQRLLKIAQAVEASWIVAEGVETEPDLNVLKRYGVQYVQGNILSQPTTSV